MRFFLCSLLVLGAVPILTAQDVDGLINEGLQLEKHGDTDAAIVVLQRAADSAPDNAEVTKLLARQYVLKIEDATDAVSRKKYAQLAVSLGQKAADKLPNDAEAQATLAASYGKLCELVNPKLRIEYSKRVYAEANKAVTLDPNSDFGHMILGCWNVDMVVLNPFLRGLVQIVYGQLPPASKEEGIAHFKKAIELAPQRIVHHAEYAKALDLLGDRQDADREWTKVTELKPIYAQDRRYQVQAIERLKR
jgi:Flp pilus assembly protein TadD